MAKQELYLLKIPSSLPAKLRTRLPKIMRRELSEVRRLGISRHQPPDCLLIPDLRPCKLARFVDRPEQAVSVIPEAGSVVSLKPTTHSSEDNSSVGTKIRRRNSIDSGGQGTSLPWSTIRQCFQVIWHLQRTEIPGRYGTDPGAAFRLSGSLLAEKRSRSWGYVQTSPR